MDKRVTVRKRELRDLPKLAKLLVQVHTQDGYPVEGVHEPEAWLSPLELDQAWVGELDDFVVGHVGLARPTYGDAAPALLAEDSSKSLGRVMVLERLFVHPSGRRLAVGEQLVQAVMAHTSRKQQVLTLDVMEKDRAAIRLYERLGWRLLGTTDHRFGDGQSVPARCYVAP